jgi:hypothetical protein
MPILHTIAPFAPPVAPGSRLAGARRPAALPPDAGAAALGIAPKYRVAQGEGWSSRSQWHPIKDDNVLFPADTKVEPAAPPESPVEVTSTRKRGAV